MPFVFLVVLILELPNRDVLAQIDQSAGEPNASVVLQMEVLCFQILSSGVNLYTCAQPAKGLQQQQQQKGCSKQIKIAVL